MVGEGTTIWAAEEGFGKGRGAEEWKHMREEFLEGF